MVKYQFILELQLISKGLMYRLKELWTKKNWNNAKGLAKGNKEEVKSLNHYLEQVRASIVSDYQQMVLGKKAYHCTNSKTVLPKWE